MEEVMFGWQWGFHYCFKFSVWVASIFHIRTKKKPKAFSVGDRHSSSCLLPLFLCRLPRIPLKAPFLKWHVSPFCYSAANCFSDVKSLHKHLCTWPDRHQSHRTDVTKSQRGRSQLGRSWAAKEEYQGYLLRNLLPSQWGLSWYIMSSLVFTSVFVWQILKEAQWAGWITAGHPHDG